MFFFFFFFFADFWATSHPFTLPYKILLTSMSLFIYSLYILICRERKNNANFERYVNFYRFIFYSIRFFIYHKSSPKATICLIAPRTLYFYHLEIKIICNQIINCDRLFINLKKSRSEINIYRPNNLTMDVG